MSRGGGRNHGGNGSNNTGKFNGQTAKNFDPFKGHTTSNSSINSNNKNNQQGHNHGNIKAHHGNNGHNNNKGFKNNVGANNKIGNPHSNISGGHVSTALIIIIMGKV